MAAADAAELMHAGCCLSHLRFISEIDNLYFLVCCQVDSGNLLPEDEYNPNCQLESKNKCLRSGDERVNDNAGLASIHTVLVREHNRLASLLETVNPHWDEETLYQEARKMVGAEIQHITYNEFLPAILGEVLTETFQLKSKGNGYHMDYNDELPTTTLNSVGNAVLQFIPSLLPGMLEFYSPNGDKRWELAINSTYWAPSTAHDTRTVQELVMGLINAKAQKVDLNMAPGTKHCKLIQGNRNVFCYPLSPGHFLFEWILWQGSGYSIFLFYFNLKDIIITQAHNHKAVPIFVGTDIVPVPVYSQYGLFPVSVAKPGHIVIQS